MAEREIPNGETWATHQHVIMAINIKSMNDFEPADGASPVFYGSEEPFTQSEPSMDNPRISIIGTKVKTYGGIINPATPILLVTRVRDIEKGKLTDLDKKYIVCSNIEIKDANTIAATITEKVYGVWNSLPNLTKHFMLKYKDIFNRGNELRKNLIIGATAGLLKYHNPEGRIAKAQMLARKQAEEAEQTRLRAYKEEADIKNIVSARKAEREEAMTEQAKTLQNAAPETMQKVAPKIKPTTKADCNQIKDIKDRKQCVADNMRLEAAEAKKRAQAKEEEELKQRQTKVRDEHIKEETQINKYKQKRTKGGTVKDDLTELIDIISNKDLNFKKYVYFVLMQPFYFKLNALTPRMLEQIKTYNLSGGVFSGTFETHILQPFVKFSYVKYIEIKEDLVNHLSSFIEHPEQSNIVSNFAGQIEKDTKNYNEITMSKDAGYYIHIFRFIELIEKTLKKYPPNDKPLPEKVTNFIKYALENIHLHMMRVESLFDLLSSVDKILISNKMQTPKIEKPLQIYIDDYVSSQNRTDVITYLKITNTEPTELSDNHSWNQRYDIRLKQSYLAGASNYKLNAMILGYKTVPIPFYEQITDALGVKHIVAVDGLQNIVTYKTPKVDYNEIDTVKEYDNYYMFGNYENIFPLYDIDGKKETNLNNAKQMTAIIEQICRHNKPVFLLGYGASGSGKTSSLIYLNKGKTVDEQNGIVIHLCKEIIAKLHAADPTQIKSVKVVVKEFYMTNELQTNKSAEYIFDQMLELPSDNKNSYNPKHTYHVNMNKPLEEFKTMGQVLKQLVDVDRYVKATTNNPQSSRSHVLVFIQFCSDDKGETPIRHLIIGDFAGKENAFQCADTDTIVAFLNTKIENSESKYQGYPFYSAQIKGGDGNYENDPTNILQPQTGVINTRKYISSAMATNTVYNFEKPFASGHFIKNDTIPNQEKYIKSAMKYQLNRLFNIMETDNRVIYNRLLNVGEPLYSQLMRPDMMVPLQKRPGIDSHGLPSMHPGIGLIDKYSLVRTEKTDDTAVDIMIRNMCTDFNTTQNRNEKLSCQDVLYLSFLTDYSTKAVEVTSYDIRHIISQINNLYGKNIEINIDEYDIETMHSTYCIILKTALLIYIYSNTSDANARSNIFNGYIKNAQLMFTSPLSPDEMKKYKSQSPKIRARDILFRNRTLSNEMIEQLGNGSNDYTLDSAIQMVQEIYHKLYLHTVPFKYYQKDEIILSDDKRPAKIINIEFKVPKLVDSIEFWSISIVFKIDGPSQNALLVPAYYGFPVLAGEENGDIQMLKQLILEELFEVQSCNFVQPIFTVLHLGLPLNKDNESQMKSIGMSIITFNYPSNSGKTNINDYKFVDTEYSSILQRSKPTIKKITDPSDYDTFFVSTVNNMIKYVNRPTLSNIFKTTYTSPFLCSQITDDVIAQLLTKFPNDDKTMVDGTKYSIVVTHPDKIPYYADKFDNNRKKPIPIVKTFTIADLSKHIMENRFDFLFPFFEIKGLPYCQLMQNGSYNHNYVKELKYILDSLHIKFDDNLSPIIDDMHKYMVYINESRNNITETMVRLKHGKQICENRLNEGKYINSSLDQIRAAFKYILNKKHENSDMLFHSPDFIDICLQSYCPSGINCFNTSSTDNAPESLIDEIYKQLYPNQNVDSKPEFYKDLVISVFGVFNNSRLADNPPAVPYIDINHLKQIYYNTDSEYSQKYPILWALHELKLQIDDLKIKHSLSFYAGLKTLIESATEDYKEAPSSGVLTITRTGISKGFMANLKKMIESIDIHNAASTIGTLEFLDQLSKFNSVNNLCYKNKGSDTTPYLDDSEYDTYMTQNTWRGR